MKIRNFLLASAALAGFSAGLASEASAQANEFFAVLDGESECNAAGQCRLGDLDGVGSAAVMIFGPNNLCAVIAVDNLAGATSAHIHRGGTTFVGGVVVTLAPPFNNGGGNPGTSMICNNAVLAALITNIRTNPQDFYVNVHNAAFPGGAVRGQLF